MSRWQGVYLTLGTWKGWYYRLHLRLAPSGPDGHQGEREHPWDLKGAGTTDKDVHTASDSGEGDLHRVVSVVSSCPWVPPLDHPRRPRQVYPWSSPLCVEMEGEPEAGADSEGSPIAPWFHPPAPSISALVTGVFLQG